MDALDWLSRRRDEALAAGLGLVYVAEELFSGEVTHHRASAALVGAVFAATFVVRRTMPLLLLLGASVVIQLNHTVLPGLGEGGSFMLGLILTVFAVGSYLRGRLLVLGGVLVAGVIPLAALDPDQPPQVGDWIFFLTFVGTPYVAGILFRLRRERDVEMSTRARRAEEDGARRAEEAVDAERRRIARELHDVVAHAISVVVVQARAGRRSLDVPHPDGVTRASFDAIEHAGEQALVEMRRLLSLLREADGEPAGLEPQAGLRQLDALARDISASGLRVEVCHEGDPVEIPPGVDLSAYRIVQEALTNALKHAGPATARVVVRYLPGELEVEVLDDGDGSGPGGGSGQGLTGIRERVEVYGGRLQAGATPQGGFAVRARLPLEAAT
jgi:signal transduction histidine kinase